MSLKRLLVNDLEMKYFIFPLEYVSASCNVISLGIGGETESEENLRRLMPQCNFLGIDSGAASSKVFYEQRLGGTYVEGLVGAKNGTFSANVLALVLATDGQIVNPMNSTDMFDGDDQTYNVNEPIFPKITKIGCNGCPVVT
uniref:Uncharacterized protein n=1 Tax=Panagrolaimus sp. ES5 TaxID=591445 RepID=A0AC34FRL0_9BILA